MWKIGLLDIIDITLVAVVIYSVLQLIRGTRAVQMLIGIFVVAVVYFLARTFDLLTVEWIFGNFFSAFIVILVVLFQQEIRRGLMRMAINPLGLATEKTGNLVDLLVESSFSLVHKGWGGLIVIERGTGLKHLHETGVEMKTSLHPDIVQSLFCPQAPMHDGAIIVADRDIVAARVLLPLAQARAIPAGLGTRHRAAVGISEESDALVIVVSEEAGNIRLAEDGRLSKPLDHTALHEQLSNCLSIAEPQRPQAERS